MSCFNPIKANLISYAGGKCVQLHPYGWEEGRVDSAPFDWYVKKDGVMTPVVAYRSECIWLPCGKCEACLHERSKQWALRCVKESKKYDKTCFLTLTYNDHFLPQNNSLVKSDLQKFIKRLRKAIEPVKIRYFACGEYGSKGERPHYHLCIFGWSPDDMQVYNDGIRYFRYSKQLEKLWKFGFVSVGELTFKSCFYVAQYVQKKIGKEVLGDRTPEFLLMSTRPAICRDFFESDLHAICERGFVFCNGSKVKVPRYADKLLERQNPRDFAEIKQSRKKNIQSIDMDLLKRKQACFVQKFNKRKSNGL